MCAWWNPADWLKGAGSRVAEGIADAIGDLGDRVKDDPRIVLVPTAVVLGSVTLGYGAREYGIRLGQEFTMTALIDEVM